MQPVRLAICGLPQLAGDIVRTLVEDVPFIDVVEPVEPSGDLAADFALTSADVMLCSLPEEELKRQWRAAVAERPPIAVLNLVDDNVRGRLHALYPQRLTVEPLTGKSLVAVLRAHRLRLGEGDRS